MGPPTAAEIEAYTMAHWDSGVAFLEGDGVFDYGDHDIPANRIDAQKLAELTENESQATSLGVAPTVYESLCNSDNPDERASLLPHVVQMTLRGLATLRRSADVMTPALKG